MQTDMAEKIIQLVTILFLLSMICERVADFFKHYLCGSEFFKIGDTITKTPGNDIKEQARAYRILKINVWCGIITASILKADLIKILNNVQDAGSTLGWANITSYNLRDVLFLIPGIVLTGCFISFGSKFWHDLLDILYQIKNAKRILTDPNLSQIDNIKSLEKVINTYQSDFIKGAYLQAKSEFMLRDNIRAVSLKMNESGLYYFELKARDLNTQIDPFYNYLLQDGTPQSIPVKVVLTPGEDRIIAHSIDLSSIIFESLSPSKVGTLGFIVKPESDPGDQRYILTCAHNVVHPVTNAKFVKPGTRNVGSSDASLNPIGKIFLAERDHEMDVALIEIDPTKADGIFNSIPELSEPAGIRTLTDQDKNVKAFLYGAESNYQEGTVTSLTGDAKIEYSTDVFQMINLLTIEGKAGAMSKLGDSGCVVVDEKNMILGIVVAGDSKVTYVIPIEKVLKKLKMQLA